MINIPDKTEFRRLLESGHGRAIVFLLNIQAESKNNALKEYNEIILDCCLHNLALDTQLEDNGIEYLAPILEIPVHSDYFRNAILESLESISFTEKIDNDCDRLLGFAAYYAKLNDNRAKQTVYNAFIQSSDEYIGKYIIDIDGIPGLMWAMDYTGLHSDKTNHYPVLIKHAEELYDEELVRRSIKTSVITDGIQSYLNRYKDHYALDYFIEDILQTKQNAFYALEDRNSIKQKTWDEIKHTHSKKAYQLCSWAKNAPETEILKAAIDLSSFDNPHQLAHFLRAFRDRIYPLGYKQLIGYFHSPSEKVSQAALSALGNIEHNDVRNLYESLIEDQHWANDCLILLRSNYRSGDHITIEKMLKTAVDDNTFHETGFDFLEIYRKYELPEMHYLLKYIYDNGRCSYCRLTSVEFMEKANILTKDILNECLYDSNEYTREIAEKHLR